MSLFSNVSSSIRARVVSGALANTTNPLTFTLQTTDGFSFQVGGYIVAWNDGTYSTPDLDPNARIGTVSGRTYNSLTVTWGKLGTPITSISGTPLIAQINPNLGLGDNIVQLSALRQDNATNSHFYNSIVLTGWGVFAQGAVASKSLTVNFGVTFTQAPITVAVYAGDNVNISTAYGSGGNNSKGAVCIKAHTQTTTSMIVQVHTADGTSWGANDNVFFTWMAIGEIA